MALKPPSVVKRSTRLILAPRLLLKRLIHRMFRLKRFLLMRLKLHKQLHQQQQQQQLMLRVRMMTPHPDPHEDGNDGSKAFC
jgi:hypothetical protein